MNTTGSSLWVSFIMGVVLLSLIGSAVVNLQLFQDGSSYLFEILVSHSAIRHNRISAFLIQFPTILAGKLLTTIQFNPDTSLKILRIIFSLSYSLVPFISLVISWFILPFEHKNLFVWPAIGILMINLVNFSWVSEFLISLQFSCPIILVSIIMPGKRASWILITFMLPFIVFLHGLASIVLLFTAICIAAIGLSEIPDRKPAKVCMIIFLIAAVLGGVINFYSLNPYTKSFFESGAIVEYFFITTPQNMIFLAVSVIIGLICLMTSSNLTIQGGLIKVLFILVVSFTFWTLLSWNNFYGSTILNSFILLISLITAMLGYRYGFYNSNNSAQGNIKCLYLYSMVLTVIAGFFLMSHFFVGDAKFPLKTGLTLLAFMSVILMMSVDSLRKISCFECMLRLRLVTVLCILFALLICTKSYIWHSSIQRLEQSITTTSALCIELTSQDFTWLKGRPYNIIHNWALPTLALVIQDTRPRKLLLEESDCKLFYEFGIVQIDPWTGIPERLLVPPL